MKKFWKIFIVFAFLSVLSIGIGAVTQWFNTASTNTINYVDQKIDDRTRYETRKKVEDQCRASISSYETDKTTWIQYKDSESELERSWAEQAKMRANKTANIYNNYILKNSYVFEGNIPSDIYMELPILY